MTETISAVQFLLQRQKPANPSELVSIISYITFMILYILSDALLYFYLQHSRLYVRITFVDVLLRPYKTKYTNHHYNRFDDEIDAYS